MRENKQVCVCVCVCSDEQERIRQEAHESRVRSQAQRRRKEEVERAKMEALDMRWWESPLLSITCTPLYIQTHSVLHYMDTLH